MITNENLLLFPILLLLHIGSLDIIDEFIEINQLNKISNNNLYNLNKLNISIKLIETSEIKSNEIYNNKYIDNNNNYPLYNIHHLPSNIKSLKLFINFKYYK